MKQRIKKYAKICLAGVLTLALAVQAFTGFGVSTKAADSESEYTEMKFGDWGVSEGSGTAYDGNNKAYTLNYYSLTDSSKIPSLNGVAISGKINFNSTNRHRITIGGTANLKNAGFWLGANTTNCWVTSCQGIGTNYGESAIWDTAAKFGNEVELRLTFDKATDSDSWTVNVYADNKLIQTRSYNGVTPGLYIGLPEGVTVDMTPSEPEGTGYTEMKFGDWGVVEGSRTLESYNLTLYSLTDSNKIPNLDGVAISGTVNFNGKQQWMTIGGTSSAMHGGFWLRAMQENGWTMACQGIGTDYASAIKWKEGAKFTSEVELRLTFDKASDSNTWTVNTYADDNLIGTWTYTGVTPGLYIGLPEGVTVDMTPSESEGQKSKTVYVGSYTGTDSDGSTDKPYTTLNDAIAAINSAKEADSTITDGRIVLTSDITVVDSSSVTLEACNVPLTVTSKTNTRNKLILNTASEKNILYCTSQIEFNSVIFQMGSTAPTEIWSGTSLTFGENVSTYAKDATTAPTTNQFCVRMGATSYAENAYFKMQTGTVNVLQGGNDTAAVGSSTIILGSNAKISGIMQCSGTNQDVTTSKVTIDGAAINALYIGGYGTATLQNLTMNVTDAEINYLYGQRNATTVTVGQSGTISGSATLNFTGCTIGIMDISKMTISGAEDSLTLTDCSVVQSEDDFKEWEAITLANTTLYLPNGCDNLVGTTKVTADESSKILVNKEDYENLPSISNVTVAYPAADTIEFDDYEEGTNYDITKLMYTAYEAQGSATYGDTIFCFSVPGVCRMYDITTGRLIATFKLGSYNAGTLPDDENVASGTTANNWANHCGNVVFGSKKFDESDPFPLLYVTTGNAAKHDGTGAYIPKCAIERIRQDANGVWYSEIVQIIEFNDFDYIPEETDADGNVINQNKNMASLSDTTETLINMYNSETGKFMYMDNSETTEDESQWQKVGWGSLNYFVDSDPTEETAGKFYTFCPRFYANENYEAYASEVYGNGNEDWNYNDYNAYIITEFDMPDLPASEDDSSYGGTVTLYVSDIIDQFETEYDISFTQSGVLYQGRIYYCYGLHGKETDLYTRNGIRVFDIAEKKIVSKLALYTDSELQPKEPEGLSIWNGHLVLGLLGKNGNEGYHVYAFDYVALDETTTCESGDNCMECSLCGKHLTTLITIGDGTTTGQIQISVSTGDTLPKGYLNEGDTQLYVIGWTDSTGNAATTYTDGETYTAKFIDTKMLAVGTQTGASANEGYVDYRFIGSINGVEGYSKVGFVFSKKNVNPEMDGTCLNREKTTVYEKMNDNGTPKTAKEIYGSEYSKYLFAHEFSINKGTTLYVRAYVVLEDGTVVYGKTATITVPADAE